LDVHANSIDVTAAETGAGREVRHVGSIGGDLASLDRVLRKLRSDGAKLHVVYEAGPCGFVIARHLREQAIDCEVVAPSMIPRRRENPHAVAPVLFGYRRHESRLRVIRLCGDQLHDFVGQTLPSDHHGQLIPRVGSLREDVHNVEGVRHSPTYPVAG
jgi:hypothetical protein